MTAQELVWSAGGELIDDEGRVMPDDADFRERPATAAGDQPAGQSRPFDEAASTRQFREGRTLFMRNWPVAFRDLYGDTEKPPPDFGVIALPENSGALGGQNLAVSASTRRYQDAVDLIKFLTDDARQTTLYNEGRPAGHPRGRLQRRRAPHAGSCPRPWPTPIHGRPCRTTRR